MNSENFVSKYLVNGDRYEVGPHGALSRRSHGLSIAIVKVTLDDLEGSKINAKD